jgi:hypothetical protein
MSTAEIAAATEVKPPPHALPQRLDAIRLGADHERTKIALNKSGNRRTSFADGVGIAEPFRPGRIAQPHGDELKFADIAMGAVR